MHSTCVEVMGVHVNAVFGNPNKNIFLKKYKKINFFSKFAGIKGGGWSRKGLNFEWPYFSQYLSELYQIFSSCVLCGYIIN